MSATANSECAYDEANSKMKDKEQMLEENHQLILR